MSNVENDVRVRLLKGEDKLFLNARKTAKKRGYPDVMSYLYATSQISGCCELVSIAEEKIWKAAQAARRKCQLATQ